MTKHFQEERCSCFIGEHQYTLKQLVEMERGLPPKPPPIREYRGLGIKPIILKTLEGLYVCEIPIENEPGDDSPDDVWWKWAATGVGVSPLEAYNNWVKDWERYV